MVMPTIVNPPGLGPPVGYSHGVRAGNLLFVAGQVGAKPSGDGRLRLVSSDFATQFETALLNVLEVVKTAGGKAENIVEITIFVKKMEAYRSARTPLAAVWRRSMGKHYPAITLVEVSDLFEPGALVELRAVAAME